MNKILLIVIIISLGVYFSYKNQLTPAQPVVYGEARITFQTGGREVELVTIGQRYGTDNCQEMHDLVFEKLDAMCQGENACIESSYQCKNELDPKYMYMFDKQPSRTHYMHIHRQGDNLAGVILFWGLTDDESRQVCNVMLQKILSNKTNPVIPECI